jgi:hypothetical protein
MSSGLKAGHTLLVVMCKASVASRATATLYCLVIRASIYITYLRKFLDCKPSAIASSGGMLTCLRTCTASTGSVFRAIPLKSLVIQNCVVLIAFDYSNTGHLL